MFDIVSTVVIISSFTGIFFVGLKLFEKRIYGIVDAIGDIFSEILTKPAVSTAFGILGSASGEARGNRAMADKLATDILNGPKFGALKMGASALGINIDDYIEENGAMNTITGLQSIAGALGININDILSSGAVGLTSPESNSGGANPYL